MVKYYRYKVIILCIKLHTFVIIQYKLKNYDIVKIT